MNFLTDENIFLPIVDWLRQQEHDVFDIKEQNLSGSEDSDVFAIAVKHKRILITMDKDFSSILEYPPGKHPGIIVLKLYRIPVERTTEIFKKSFATLKSSDIDGNIVIIDKNKTRVRKS